MTGQVGDVLRGMIAERERFMAGPCPPRPTSLGATQATAELAALRAALADAEDAARYRFLRDHAGISFQMVMQERREADEWDAEIDEARARTQEADRHG